MSQFSGETAVLTARVEGNPVPTFKWMRGNREVLPGGRFKYHTDGQNVRKIYCKWTAYEAYVSRS